MLSCEYLLVYESVVIDPDDKDTSASKYTNEKSEKLQVNFSNSFVKGI